MAPQVGTLYKPQTIPGPTLYTQPGGPGTLVYPQQPLGEKSAQYSFGCGHFFNIPRIWEEFDPVSGEQAAIIACPICTFIQQIVIPYSLYLNYIQTPIVIA